MWGDATSWWVGGRNRERKKNGEKTNKMGIENKNKMGKEKVKIHAQKNGERKKNEERKKQSGERKIC